MYDIPAPPTGDLLLVYADDVLVASSGPRARTINQRVNGYLEVLMDFFNRWKLRLNVRKTDAIIIKGRRKYLYPNSRSFIPSLRVEGELIGFSDRMKYLGVMFHENFEFYRHIDLVLGRTKRVFATYRGILGVRRLNKRTGLLLYRQIIRPLMSYAFPVWFRISSAQMERLRVWERRILTACLGLRGRRMPDGTYRRPPNGSIYRAIDFERIDAYLTRSGIAFLDKAVFLENSLVQACFERSENMQSVQSSRYMSPSDLLALNEAGLLYQGADLLFYHRRVNTLDIFNTVYSTVQ